MSEKISALMDGELEAHEQRGPYAELAREGEAIAAWRTYHLIGDALRDALPLSAGFATRMAANLAAEPTVLAPHGPPVDARPRWRALQVAAGFAAVALVGSMWFAPQDAVPRKPEVALAKPVAEVPAAKVPLPSAAGDYLLAHQAYSPRGNLQGVAPYVRTVSESVRRK
jgi:sigma-E factor negative regulatory protein RseA